jgi:hypothetical protein
MALYRKVCFRQLRSVTRIDFSLACSLKAGIYFFPLFYVIGNYTMIQAGVPSQQITLG